MKIAVIGAGAIGGLVGAKLALAGEDVTFIVRGANLDAIRSNGFKLVTHDGSEHVARQRQGDRRLRGGRCRRTSSCWRMKAHQVDAVADDVPQLIGPETLIVTMQNGIPFWYFHDHGGALAGTVDASVDPSGAHRGHHPAAAGHRLRGLSGVRAGGARRGPAHRGRPLPDRRARWQHAASGCAASPTASPTRGFKAPVLDNIRAEIWLKLWGNLTFNPISGLSHSTLVDICQYPLTRELAAEMMREAQAVAQQARHRVPRLARQAHRRRREGRQAQDLDAAGHRGRPRAGDRRAGRLGGRARRASRTRRRRTSTRSTRSSSCSPARCKKNAARFGCAP